ncbi:hypothetical protein AVEN_102717-1 [Araneus ventricosus]|uniref:Uncharacterized protein n=1 Tax=Araneus ventricosus TaxID=182803 RepID=A0A4Y2UAQ4_ARAVE|nr:hypothetical protein AVEN_102717-1 [Araneus ventricosus]
MHEKARLCLLSQDSFHSFQSNGLGKSFTNVPKFVLRYLFEKVQSRRHTSTHPPPLPQGEFLSLLASSRDFNLGKSFVFPSPSQRCLKRSSGHCNQTSNYSKFQTYDPIGASFHWVSSLMKGFPIPCS